MNTISIFLDRVQMLSNSIIPNEYKEDQTLAILNDYFNLEDLINILNEYIDTLNCIINGSPRLRE